ncbi:hypothetical protein N752_27620 [Desulforamulus aquiferis]|nr:hypothetical protein [Desulforamulus aquiferis]RYD01897.1 hypothetical protein N752_27620 [Desulforamulus aquiferis]
MDRGIFTLDFYTPLLSKDTGNPELLLDGGHPTPGGYKILGDEIITQLRGRLYL